MAAITLIVDTDKGNSKVKLSNIPENTWSEFVKTCANLVPGSDDEKTAWGAVIGALISNENLLTDLVLPYLIAQAEQKQTFILSGIPKDAYEMLDVYASQCNLRPAQLIGHLYRSAQESKLHILNITPFDDDGSDSGHVLYVGGLTTKAWLAWSDFAKESSKVTGEHYTPETLIAHLMELSADGVMSVSVAEDDKTPKPNEAEEELTQTDLDEMQEMKEKLEGMIAKWQT